MSFTYKLFIANSSTNKMSALADVNQTQTKEATPTETPATETQPNVAGNMSKEQMMKIIIEQQKSLESNKAQENSELDELRKLKAEIERQRGMNEKLNRQTQASMAHGHHDDVEQLRQLHCQQVADLEQQIEQLKSELELALHNSTTDTGVDAGSAPAAESAAATRRKKNVTYAMLVRMHRGSNPPGKSPSGSHSLMPSTLLV